jgi:hypothetical protein
MIREMGEILHLATLRHSLSVYYNGRRNYQSRVQLDIHHDVYFGRVRLAGRASNSKHQKCRLLHRRNHIELI